MSVLFAMPALFAGIMVGIVIMHTMVLAPTSRRTLEMAQAIALMRALSSVYRALVFSFGALAFIIVVFGKYGFAVQAILAGVPGFLAGCATGIIVMQTMVLAPTLFRTLEMAPAGALLRALFPKFFLLIAALGVATFVTTVFSEAGSTAQAILAAVTIVLPLVCWALIPMTNQATDTGNTARFKILHMTSVLLTVVVLLSNITIALL